jgi:IMP dehydrogenase/GMP reductase
MFKNFFDTKLSLNDISIVPCVTTNIKSREECNPYIIPYIHNFETLPLFTAPMSTVVGEENIDLFYANKIEPILPRNFDFDIRIKKLNEGYWCAFGLSDIEHILKNNIIEKIQYPKILIDVANGHMNIIYELSIHIRKQNKNSIIMVGNIANPETYITCCEHKINYVRLGIGGGSGCLTATNIGVFYPIVDLIDEINTIKKTTIRPNTFKTKIIADGCARNYSDIIKALALGADRVMCGKLFAQMLETPGEIKAKYKNGMSSFIVNRNEDEYRNTSDSYPFKDLENNPITLTKEFYGMASKRGQEDFCVPRLKTAEGKVETIEIKYSMRQWVENFTDYLRSAMSYTGKRDIEDFIGGVNIIKLSENASNSFNK